MKFTDVLVKWTGSKRLQAPEIIKRFPKKFETYYEPFLGGASMLYCLLKSNIQFKRCECSDLNESLIGIWRMIQSKPLQLLESYAERWHKLKEEGKDYYYKVRAEYNEDHDPAKFFFLLRTCRNGLVRYNLKGTFTSAFHLGRNGMKPSTIQKTMNEWHRLLTENEVHFSVKDYQTIQTAPGDLLYLDPPYALPSGRNVVMYYGMIEFQQLWEWLGNQRCGYLMSLNGYKGDEDRTVGVPPHLYDEHVLIDNGLNKYDQLCNKRVVARDSLYLKHLESQETG